MKKGCRKCVTRESACKLLKIKRKSYNSTDEDVVHRNVCRLVNTIPVFYSFTVSKRNQK